MATHDASTPRETLDWTDRVLPQLRVDLEDDGGWVPYPSPLISIPPIATVADRGLAPLTAARAADGTRTKVHAVPPPVPARARRAAASAPPPPAALDFAITYEPAVIEPVVAAVIEPAVNEPVVAAEIEPGEMEAAEIEPTELEPATLEPAVTDEPWSSAPPRSAPPPPAWMSVAPALPVAPIRVDTPALLAAPPALAAPEQFDSIDATAQPTRAFASTRRFELTRKRAAIGGGLVVASGLIAYLALAGGGGGAPAVASHVTPTAPTPTVAAAPAPAPAPVKPAPVKPAPRLSVPVTSNPTGATVTVVDDGHAAIVGVTPIAVSIDPTRSYDIVVALADHPTRITHLAPLTTPALAVELGSAPAKAAPQPPAAPRSAPTKHVAAAAPAPRRAAPARVAAAPARVAAAPAPAPAHGATGRPAPTGSGTLMVSSKPPCELVIDGKPTHLVTPQRAIVLPAGSHSVTFVNAPHRLRKTVQVQISARHATKLIEDLMKR